mgnify:CR=1 FL=1
MRGGARVLYHVLGHKRAPHVTLGHALCQVHANIRLGRSRSQVQSRAPPLCASNGHGVSPHRNNSCCATQQTLSKTSSAAPSSSSFFTRAWHTWILPGCARLNDTAQSTRPPHVAPPPQRTLPFTRSATRSVFLSTQSSAAKCSGVRPFCNCTHKATTTHTATHTHTATQHKQQPQTHTQASTATHKNNAPRTTSTALTSAPKAARVTTTLI